MDDQRTMYEKRQEMYKKIYMEDNPDDSWFKYFQTRDWYDIPDSIRDNSYLYWKSEAMQRKPYREKLEPNHRFYIFPKDIQFIYDFTPDLARDFINEVRESFELSVGVPITCYDLQKYTQLDIQTILDFIMES